MLCSSDWLEMGSCNRTSITELGVKALAHTRSVVNMYGTDVAIFGQPGNESRNGEGSGMRLC